MHMHGDINLCVSFWLLNELTRRIYENEVVLVRLTRQSTNEITTILLYPISALKNISGVWDCSTNFTVDLELSA